VSRPKVIITAKLPDAVEQKASALFDATLNPTDTPLTAAQLIEAARSADALLPNVTDKITADVLGADGRRIKIVANYGVGFNNVDVAAATCAMAIDVAALAMPGMLWCSASQKRLYPHRSACCARSTALRNACAASPPSTMGARSRTERGVTPQR